MPFGIANVTCSCIHERRGRWVSTALIGSLWYDWCTTLFWGSVPIGLLGPFWRSFPYVRVHLGGSAILELTLVRCVVLAAASLYAFSSLALELEWDGFNRPIVSWARVLMPLIA